MNNADRVDLALTEIQGQRWSGPERDERIEKLIREVQHMKQAEHKRFSRGTLIAVGLAALIGGGAVAGVVTRQIMAQRVQVIDENGNEWEFVLAPEQDGSASGSFTTQDGTTYDLEVVPIGNQTEVNANVEGGAGGTVELTIEPILNEDGEIVPVLKAGDQPLEEIEIEDIDGN